MKIFDDLNIKHYLSIASFICAVIFGFVGIFCSPIGEISSSVNILIALCFMLTATLLGIRIDLDKSKGKLKVDQQDQENK